MQFVESPLAGAYVIDLEPIEDARGFFARTWCEREYLQRGLTPRIVQCSVSYNRTRGTLRGMHYQAAPFEEVRVVRCVRGAIYDVLVDIRPESATFRGWVGYELNAENRRSLYVPPGFAHGFQTLTDDAEVLYQMSEFFQPDYTRGVRWDDPAFGIGWPPVSRRIVSPRDAALPDFRPEPRPLAS